MSSAGSRLVSLETIDQTETGRRWLIMLLFALTQEHGSVINGTFLLRKYTGTKSEVDFKILK